MPRGWIVPICEEYKPDIANLCDGGSGASAKHLQQLPIGIGLKNLIIYKNHEDNVNGDLMKSDGPLLHLQVWDLSGKLKHRATRNPR